MADDKHEPKHPSPSSPIGVFDSGVGGLSVLRAIRRLIPNEDLIYLADQTHVPYGSRSLDEVRRFSEAISHYFLETHSVKQVVVACNTASAAALHHLRDTFPDMPFVGMEPAVKPAAENTLSGVVGVLATPATFQGELYASVVERFANGVSVLQHDCPGLVAEIEAGRIDGPVVRGILQEALGPMLEQGLDTVVLGCTHYPFVIPVIQQVVGSEVQVIDPAPAVARQAARLLGDRGLRSSQDDPGSLRCLTTGEPAAFARLATELLGEPCAVARVGWGKELKLEK